MRHLALVLPIALTVGAPIATASGPVDDAAVVRQLASPDPQVRQAALVEVVLRGDADAERVLGAVAPTGVGAESVLRARGARALSKRLAAAPRDSRAFWRLFEVALGAEWRELEPAIVLEATHRGPADRAALLSQRAEALGVVSQFCARGAEFFVPDGDPLAARLAALGPRAAPHLLHVLAYDPWSSFWGVGGGAFALTPPGALEQGGAAVALGRLKVKEAVPYLLFHLQGPSFTVEGGAATALRDLSGVAVPWGKDGRFDSAAVSAWWEGERKSRSVAIQDFVEDVLGALTESLPVLEQMTYYAADYAKYDQPLGSTYAALERISGRALGPVPTGTLEQRLAGIRGTLAAVRSAGSARK